MLAIKNLVACAALAAVMPVVAAPIFIDFEDSPLDPALVGDTYKNSLGVVFSDNAYTLHSNYSNLINGSPNPAVGSNFIRYGSSSTAALGVFSSDLYINVAAGFAQTFSLLYTSSPQGVAGVDFVELFTGENGSGSAINAGSRPGAQLGIQAPCVDPTGSPQPGIACTWSEISLSFTGTAKSVHISGASGVYLFDNLNFGPLASTPPGTNVPEPGGIALSLAALGALAWTRKRNQR